MFQFAMTRYGISFLASLILLAALLFIPFLAPLVPVPSESRPRLVQVSIAKKAGLSVPESKEVHEEPEKKQRKDSPVDAIEKVFETETEVMKPELVEVEQASEVQKEVLEEPVETIVTEKPSSLNDQSPFEEPLEADRTRSEQLLSVAEDDYRKTVLTRIAEKKLYPRGARSRGQEGEVQMCIVIGSDGAILSLEICKNSGFRLLDQATIRAVEKAAPFPQLPIKTNSLAITFTMDYRLN